MTRLVPIIWIVLACAALLWFSGCATQQQIAALQKQNKIDIANAIAAGKLKGVEATTRPTAHPIEWANVIEQEIAGPAKAMAWTCTVLALGGLGAWIASAFFTTLAVLLSTLGKLVLSICGAIGGGCWLVLFLLPWALWIIGAVVLLIVGVVLYFLSQAHWSIATLFGLHQANAAKIEAVTPLKMDIAAPGSQSQPLVGNP